MPWPHRFCWPSVLAARSRRAEQRVVASEDARRQSIVEDGLLIVQSEVLQRDVDVREGHRERARGRAAVAILAGQCQRRRAIGRDAGGEGIRTAAPGASLTRSRSAPIGSSTAPAVPDNARPSSDSGFASDRPRPRNRARSVSSSTDPPSRGPSTPSTWKATSVDFVGRPRPAREQQAGTLRIELGLDEQLAEGRMREVVLQARQRDLGVARHLELAGL